jgi:hypothetical protein
MKRCNSCIAKVGPISEFYCDYHAGYNVGNSAANMAAKRAADPDYRETEREAVKRRMRRLRRVRQKNGISGNSHRDSTALSSVR